MLPFERHLVVVIAASLIGLGVAIYMIVA